MSERQHHYDSIMETACNTAVGMVLSFVVWQIVAVSMGIPMPLGRNAIITSIFTVVSLARQYVIRRAFNGRSIWQVVKRRLHELTKQGRYERRRRHHREAVGIPNHRRKTREVGPEAQ